MSYEARIGRREWIWLVAASGAILFLVTLPYLLSCLAQTPAMPFSGALLDQEDYHAYLARMWQGYRGEWSTVLLFTTESHPGVWFMPLYNLMGHVARVTGLSFQAVYHLSRTILAGWLLVLVYRFIAIFTESVRTRRTAFLLAVMASGLGWLTESVAPTAPGGVSPMDFWLLDGFVYLSLLVSPHFCLSTALVLVVCLECLRFTANPSWRSGVLMVGTSLVLGLVHPYMLLIIDLVPGLFWAIDLLRTRNLRWARFVVLCGMALIQLPLVAYTLRVQSLDPVYIGWSEQLVMLSPPLRVYLFGYGGLLILAICGVLTWLRKGPQGVQKLVLPLIWIGLVAAVVYLPWNLQRRFLEGAQVPLGLLAGIGLAEGVLPRSSERVFRRRELARVGLIAMSAMSNLYLTSGLALAAAQGNPALFLDGDVAAGVDWLGEETGWNDTVLAGPETGNLIPGRIGHRVVIGHWIETVDYSGKLESVSRFYGAGMSDAERVELLKGWDVAYVFSGPEEERLGDFDPATVDYLIPVYRNDVCAIYRVALRASQ